MEERKEENEVDWKRQGRKITFLLLSALSPLPAFFLFFSLLFDLEPGHGRSSSGPISLNSRGVHEVCEMAKPRGKKKKETSDESEDQRRNV